MPNDATDTAADRAEDRALLDRLVAGDESGWEEFDRRYRGRIAAAVRLAGIPDDYVEDVGARVVEKLLADRCRRLREWRGEASLATYLHIVSVNIARDFRPSLPQVGPRVDDERFDERYADQGAALPPELLPEARAVQAQLRWAILECLVRMNVGADREILLYHYYVGLPAEDIGRLLGKSRNAVDQALHRARRSLRAVAERSHPELLEYLGTNDHVA